MKWRDGIDEPENGFGDQGAFDEDADFRSALAAGRNEVRDHESDLLCGLAVQDRFVRSERGFDHSLGWIEAAWTWARILYAWDVRTHATRAA